MAKIKKLGEGVFTTIADGIVAAALSNVANVASQNNVLEIEGVSYQLDTLVFSEGGAIGFGESNFDVTLHGSVGIMLNVIPEGVTYDAGSIEGNPHSITAHIDREGYTGEVELSLEDADGLLDEIENPTFTVPGTLTVGAAASSVGAANVKVKDVVAPGTYNIVVKATVGAVEKTRTFTVVVVASGATAVGSGWI